MLFNVGIVLQALDARASPAALGLRPTFLWALAHRPRWLVGSALGLAGIAPQVVAYADAPFVVVQPALSGGLLLVLAAGNRFFGERVGLIELGGVVGIIGGIALISYGAPSHTEAHRGAVAVIGVVAGLSLAGLLPFVVRGRRVGSGTVLAVASGCAFGATNIATKLVGDDYSVHPYRAAAWSVVVVVMGVTATLVGMTAFQRRAATVVVPVSTAVQTFLPILLEPVFLRESWGSANLDGLPIAAGLGLALVGCVIVAHSSAVSRLVAGAAAG